MHALADGPTWLQLHGGLLVMALGALVGAIKPRTRANIAFTAFAFFFGGQFLLTNAAVLAFDEPPFDGSLWFEMGKVLLRTGVLVSAAVLALVFPTPLRRAEWRLLVAPSAVAVILFIGGLRGVTTLSGTAWGIAALAAAVGWIAILIGLQVLAALRFRAEADARIAHLLAFFAGALVLYTGFTATAGFDQRTDISILTSNAAIRDFLSLIVAAHVLAAGIWLRAIARSPAPRAARNLALLTMAMMLVGLVYAALDLRWGALGIVRIGMVAVIAYAIVRHQLLGIDVKLRFAISKSTLAAVFIAVFFVASEAAQQFFGDRFESGYLGILAAGALVFAFAPLSRLADKLAETAVPVVTVETADRALPEKEEMYRDAVRLALRDRVLTRAEERHLFRLARGLGLAPDRAHDILVEVEGEPGGRA